MTKKTCFVVMAIGDQHMGDKTISAATLRKHYDDLIKEAILKARPGIEVVRADDIAIPGTITVDIITRLMDSDYVVADITYPNPNVFYELGLRHACRIGTILIKDKDVLNTPFDIAHLRHVPYENTASGLKSLSAQLSLYFDYFDRDNQQPDSQFQELAKAKKFVFPDYRNEDNISNEAEALANIMTNPDLINLFQKSGEVSNQNAEIMKILSQNPEAFKIITSAMIKEGALNFRNSSPPK